MTPESNYFDFLKPQPLLIVISGPAGSGKDSVIHELKKRNFPFFFVVTITSRPPRAGEVDGVDYIFVSKEKFEDMIAKDELLEHALVYGQYKGIPKANVKKALESGLDVIMRLDVQGSATVRSKCPEAVLIFITPEGEEEWMDRLKSRKSETPEQFKIRVETARTEMARKTEFDYIIANPDTRLNDAVDNLMAIIKTERLRSRPRRITL